MAVVPALKPPTRRRLLTTSLRGEAGNDAQFIHDLPHLCTSDRPIAPFGEYTGKHGANHDECRTTKAARDDER
ncbi:MAG: hypothetical protein GEV04_24335 [Actinophytocola sp.]|nr:hypothetical protein [Actinophytocola sp.]